MSTPLVVVSMGAQTLLTTVPQDAAGYSGGSASKLVGGPSSGAADFEMTLYPGSSALTAGNLVRIFVKISGTLVFKYAVHLIVHAANADDPAWNAPIPLGVLRLCASSEEIWVSQEKNDTGMKIGVQQYNLG